MRLNLHYHQHRQQQQQRRTIDLLGESNVGQIHRVRYLGTDVHDALAEERINGEARQVDEDLAGPPLGGVLWPVAGVGAVLPVACRGRQKKTISTCVKYGMLS